MTDKKETKTDKIEREYVIPLRDKCRPVPIYRKTPKAVKSVKEFLARHMKIYDRDLNKIKIDKHLNEALWFRGIKRPPHKIKVKVVKEGEIVRVELADVPDKLKFKKLREEKREQKISDMKKKVVPKTETKSEDKNKDGIEDKNKKSKISSSPAEASSDEREESEKKASVVEEGEKLEKEMAKKTKHTKKESVKEKFTERKTYDQRSHGK